MAGPTNNAANKIEFNLQRIYVKDLSFESPQAPHVFRSEWKPEINLEMATNHQELEKDLYEVILQATVTAMQAEKTVFLVEVQQACIFHIVGADKEQLAQLLSSYCPNILFPFLRETICDVVVRGGFPQLLLAPINFDALYGQHMQKNKEALAKDVADG